MPLPLLGGMIVEVADLTTDRTIDLFALINQSNFDLLARH
jgi:hypothetical protein